MMSRDCSRSKFDGVREKLLRFRREYFCVRSSERRLGSADVREDAGQLPPLVSGRTIGYRRSCYGGQPAMTNGDRSTTIEDGGLPRRHSVPSRCVAIAESPEEEDVVVATSVCTDCRLQARNVAHAIPVSTPAVDTSVDHGLSTENDHADYDEFVHGIQSTTVTAATAIRPERPSEAAEIFTRSVCRSMQRPVGVQGTATPNSLDRRASERPGRRSLGGKLMRTLRKTFSLAGLGKNDEVEDDSLSAETFQTLSSSDKRSSHLPSTSTLVGDNLESMFPTREFNKDDDMSEWQQVVVS